MDLQQHALKLARDLDVELFFDTRPYRGYYDPRSNEIHTAPIEDHGAMLSPDWEHRLNITAETSYFVALHELGHRADPSIRVQPKWSATSEQVLAEEGRAWLWAAEHSLIEPTEEVRAFVRAALTQYKVNWPAARAPQEWATAMEVLS